MASLFCNPTLSDAATLTASDTASGFAVTRLQNFDPDRRYRSTTTTPYIEGDFGAAKAVDVLCAGFLNAVSADTVRWRLATSQANLTAAPGYDSGAISAYPGGADLSSWARIHAWKITASTQTYRWFRIDFNFASNPAGYVDFGRLIVGTKIQFATPIDFGWQRTYPTSPVWTQDMAGGITPRPQAVKNGVAVRWSWLTKAEAFGDLSPLLRDRGSSGDVFFVANDAEATYPQDLSMIGLIGGQWEITNPFNDRYVWGATLTEA